MKTIKTIGIIISIAIVVIFLVYFHISKIQFNSFVMGLSTNQITPTANLTQIAPPTSTPQAQINGDTYKVLVEYFQREVSMVLEITKWVVLVLGGLGGLGGFYVFTRIEDFKKEIKELDGEKFRIKSDLESINKDLIASKARMDQYQILIDLQNNNADIRKKAVGRLGTSDDISVISTLSEVLRNDNDLEVKREAIYQINDILRCKNISKDEVTQYRSTFIVCVESLGANLLSKDNELRQEALLAIGHLVKLQVSIPRVVVSNIRAIGKSDRDLKGISDEILNRTNHAI